MSMDITNLLDVLDEAKGRGVIFKTVPEINACLDEGLSAWFIKHDVHDISLKAIKQLAKGEKDRGIRATYFFLVPEHPLSLNSYDTPELVETAVALQQMGHAVGLHLDPYFLIDWKPKLLKETITEALETFRSADVEVRLANTHGNTAYRYVDRNGFGIFFEVYEELERQGDFPHLRDVTPEHREIILRHRFRVRDLGLEFWGDFPMWSSRNRFVVMHYMSDNSFSRDGVWDYTAFEGAQGRYKIIARQPPGARTQAEAIRFVQCKNIDSSRFFPQTRRFQARTDSDINRQYLEHLASGPAQLLIHPQFYANM